MIGESLVQRGLFHHNTSIRLATRIGICLAAGVPAGAILGLGGALYGSAALVALAVGLMMLRSLTAGLVVLVGVIVLLPFAALPVDIGFSPTILNVALLAVYFVWVSRVVTGRQEGFVGDSPTMGVLIFGILAVVSFIAGLAHASLTANILRHFLEVLLSIFVFLLAINALRTLRTLETIVGALIVFGFLAALLGVVLYLLPEDLTIRMLSLLRVVRYPSGIDVLRYIEDNPELPLRATSTSVDPNVLGGMLIFVGTLTAAQAVAAQPILPRRWLVAMLATMAVCLILTFSRGSFAGFATAILALALLRHRRLFWLALAGLAILYVLPPAQDYVQHFVRGVQGEDLATQMRFGEYRDALTLIGRYPWFGVGFAGTPDIDTYLGVSNVYLLIAQEMGVVGLAGFLGTLAAFFWAFARAQARCIRGSRVEPLLLGTCLAVGGAMVGGLFDHYLFNLVFPHASALFWLMVGLGTVAVRLTPPADDAPSAAHTPANV